MPEVLCLGGWVNIESNHRVVAFLGVTALVIECLLSLFLEIIVVFLEVYYHQSDVILAIVVHAALVSYVLGDFL